MRNLRTMFLHPAAAVLLLAWSVVPAGAQAVPPVPPGPLTLEQVLDLADPRSEAMQVAQAAIRRAEGEQVRARSSRYPQLSFQAGYDRALASEFADVFDVSGPTCPPFALNPAAPIDARVTEIERAINCGAVGGNSFFGGGSSSSSDLTQLPFGRKNTWRATFSFSQSLYSGGRNGAQENVATISRESAVLTLDTTRAQLLYDATQAYYDAVLSEQLVTIAAATLEQASATLKQTQVGFEAGTQPEFEVLRARVSRDNQLPLLIRQRTNRDTAFLRLKRILDLPPDYNLQLADSLGGEKLPPPAVFAERVAAVEKIVQPDDVAVSLQMNSPLPDRTSVTDAATTVRLREASLRLAQAQRMPSVSFNSNYGRVGYPDGVTPSFDRANWTIGASMTVPILTGGRQRGDEAVARADLDSARSTLQLMTELSALDTRFAWAEMVAARATWEASSGTIQQAQRAYQIANVRYTNGVSTQLELSDARLSLQLSEANRAQAARDLQVARARVALLPNLPVQNNGIVPSIVTPRAPQLSAPPAPAPAQPLGGGQIRNASTTPGSVSQVGFQ